MRRSLCFSWMLIAILFFFSAVPVFAQDHGAHPAPSPLDLKYDTAIWAIVVFFFLVLILRAKAWGPILEGLQKREQTIHSALEEAKTARAEMERIRAGFQKEMATAQQQIPKLIEDARKQAEELSNEIRAKAAADIQNERERLRRDVEIAKDQAIKHLWEQAAQLATLISAKAIGRSLTADDHHRLLDEAMQELRQTARN
jgi:F-type H+-transporting ATPase subunit b